jgi:hypothetical protein
LVDGTSRPIEDIKVGDLVWSYKMHTPSPPAPEPAPEPAGEEVPMEIDGQSAASSSSPPVVAASAAAASSSSAAAPPEPKPVLVARKVAATFDKGTAQCLSLLLSDGRTLRVTEDHRVLTQEGWMQAKDLVPGESELRGAWSGPR